MNRTAITTLIAIASTAAAIAGAPAPAYAQSSLSPLQRGVLIAAGGRCMSDVLTPPYRRMAAALGALAPDVASRVAPPPDELAVLTQACSLQLHQQRCAAKIVAVAGGFITAQHPAGRAVPPAMNWGTIFGGTAGLVGGVIAGNSNRVIGPIIGGAAGMYGGAKLGADWYDRTAAGSCMLAQRQLDAVSSRLVGRVNTFSPAGMLALIDANQRSQTITADEASQLRAELMRLQGQADALLHAMR
ncbi:MAG: hypothetical protein KF788_05700 [Piscinibacter sp.]|nr:hypothetical protein [Piscinibacter sp.]